MTIHHLKVGIALLLFLAMGCGYESNLPEECLPVVQDEIEEGIEMEQSIQLIMEAADIDQDGAQGAVEVLAELGVLELSEAELVSNNRGAVIRVIDSESNAYYLGFGGLGYLEIIRKGSTDGEILYAPEE